MRLFISFQAFGFCFVTKRRPRVPGWKAEQPQKVLVQQGGAWAGAGGARWVLEGGCDAGK